jgi:GDP-L-fucose synthase
MENSKEVVLVTGGTGLVGSALNNIINTPENKEKYKNYKFIFLYRKWGNLEREKDVGNIFKNLKPKYVIHLAAYVGGLFRNMNEKVAMFEKNMLINMNIIKHCHTYQVKKLICCLSTCIFPDKTSYPINESMLHDGPPHTSNDAYAYAKRMMEIHCQTYKEQFNSPFMCVIPTNIYGPGDNFSLEDGHVIPALIHKCYLAKSNNTDFTIRGSGQPLRQFLFSEDLASILIKLLFEYDINDSIIVSPNEEVPIKTISELIAKHMDFKQDLIFDQSFSDGQYKKTADNSKLLKLFPDYQFTSLSDGMKKTVAWFEKNYDSCRK